MHSPLMLKMVHSFQRSHILYTLYRNCIFCRPCIYTFVSRAQSLHTLCTLYRPCPPFTDSVFSLQTLHTLCMGTLVGWCWATGRREPQKGPMFPVATDTSVTLDIYPQVL